MNILGPTLDIHTGGIDHIPVHHTNEIAQSEAATGQRFANFWLHNNHLKVEGTKISKSLGNGYTLQNLEEKGFNPLDFRLLVLQSHYQSEGNFSFDSLAAARNRRTHWRNTAALRWQIPSSSDEGGERQEALVNAEAAIRDALSSNLNTSEALRVVDEIFSTMENQPLSAIPSAQLMSLLGTIDELLGIQLISSTPDVSDEVKQLISKREEARQNQDWEASDKLRLELAGHGLTIRDTADGSIWSYDE
jgi:cysteinyl-tRNA synthetase